MTEVPSPGVDRRRERHEARSSAARRRLGENEITLLGCHHPPLVLPLLADDLARGVHYDCIEREGCGDDGALAPSRLVQRRHSQTPASRGGQSSHRGGGDVH
jgi:hypothetical protein